MTFSGLIDSQLRRGRRSYLRTSQKSMNSELDSNLIDSHFERMLAFRERSSLRTIDYEDELVHGVYYLASVGDVGSK